MNAQTQDRRTIRSLNEAELDAVAGGPVWFVVAAVIAIPTVAATAYGFGQVVGSAIAHDEIAHGA